MSAGQSYGSSHGSPGTTQPPEAQTWPGSQQTSPHGGSSPQSSRHRPSSHTSSSPQQSSPQTRSASQQASSRHTCPAAQQVPPQTGPGHGVSPPSPSSPVPSSGAPSTSPPPSGGTQRLSRHSHPAGQSAAVRQVCSVVPSSPPPQPASAAETAHHPIRRSCIARPPRDFRPVGKRSTAPRRRRTLPIAPPASATRPCSGTARPVAPALIHGPASVILGAFREQPGGRKGAAVAQQAGSGTDGRNGRRPVVLAVEQALSMSYATLRFVHLGWRVIRVEATPAEGRRSPGDPNRYIGRPVPGAGCRSYFVAPNVGKQAIALDLKQPEGRSALQRLVERLPVDVFCTNTLPARHVGFGFDYDALRARREDLIWCCISALGPKHPDVPGYDPMLQALCGFMDLTGHPDGPPLQCGPPLADLKAGDEAFTQVILALYERERTGKGKRIDISMAQAAVSWLHTFLPMLDLGSPPEELRRSGNEHRQFIPVNAYPTRDGFLYMALGSDAQWKRFVEQPLFAGLATDERTTNEGRRRDRKALHAAIAAVTREHDAAGVSAALAAAGVPHSPITPIEKVPELPFVAATALHTTTPGGTPVRLPPPAVETPHLAERGGELPFAPGYGEHTDAVLAEVGYSSEEIAELRKRGVAA
ncbi:MAG: CoA transferase [Deltaproteobacteria bacterium]|nr:CoA transferase [Deltaproteobacteria bacterium]